MFSAEYWQRMLDEMPLLLPRIGGSLAVLFGFWMTGVLCARLIRRLANVRRLDPDLIAILSRAVKIGLLLLGIVSALGTLGINVAAMVAGLGLTGLAFGLALKEILANAMAGVQLLLYKPFKRDDRIAVLSFQGTVTEINLRYTNLNVNGAKIFIPNTLLLVNPVIICNQGRLVSTPSPLAPQIEQ
jgi:small-conductance mechanosensitive channel